MADNDEPEEIWKETEELYLKVDLSKFVEGLRRSMKAVSQDSWNLR
jgi:hypothetical protein